MRRLLGFNALLLLLTGFAVSACSDDDEDGDYPSILTELVELHVGTDSIASSFTTDRDETYQMNQRVKAYAADTTLRCLCVYQIDETTATSSTPTAQVYQMQAIFAQQPYSLQQGTTTNVDPIRLISAWQSSRWVNLYIGVVTSPNATHTFGFVQDTLAVNATTGVRIAHISLRHHRPSNATEDYTQKTYLSMPTKELSKQTDSLYLTVQTYTGTQVLTFSLRE